MREGRKYRREPRDGIIIADARMRKRLTSKDGLVSTIYTCVYELALLTLR